MTPNHLKKSIFTYAFSGMLVEQKDNEYVNEEGFKAVKDIPDDIEIPATWRWTYLPDIATICYGFPFNSEFFNETKQGRPLIRIRDIIGGKTSTYTTEDCPDEYVIKKGDMLVGMDGNFQVEYWGSEEALLNQRVCKIDANNDYLDQEYLYYYLPLILKEINGSVSFSTVKHLSAKILNAMLIPLPPLEEQHRIVAKIEELLPYVDRYAEAYEKLEQLNAKFPEDMKKSILQYAIQGKLVEQRPEEGTAEELYQQIQDEKQKLIKEGKIKKEKHLSEISEDEIPFDIPDTWKWCRIGSIFTLQAGKNIAASDIHDNQDENNKYLCYGGNGIRGFVNEPNRHGHYAIIGRQGARCGCINFAEGDFYATEHAVVVDHYNLTDTEWGGLFLKALNLNQYATATAQPGLAVANINQVLIPLPPSEEQKRIVAKINELLPYCDRLVK